MAHKTYINHIENADSAVLFIHGFLGSTEHFEEFIRILPHNTSVYNVLLKGHGEGAKEFANASMAQWKKQIEEIVDELCERYDNIYIVGHSMGTFFAMESAIRRSDRVKAIMLLQSPLKIGVKPAAAINTVKSFFNSKSEKAIAYKKAHGVKLTLKLWQYIGWIPRYLELFRESRLSRDVIKNVECPCCIFQSKKDELVSMKSVKYVPEKENVSLCVLQNSAHFIYDKQDMQAMKDAFVKMINK